MKHIHAPLPDLWAVNFSAEAPESGQQLSLELDKGGEDNIKAAPDFRLEWILREVERLINSTSTPTPTPTNTPPPMTDTSPAFPEFDDMFPPPAPYALPPTVKSEDMTKKLARAINMLEKDAHSRSKAQTVRTVGQTIQTTRINAGISRAKLAKRLRLDAGFLLQLETGVLMPEDVFLYFVGRILRQLGSDPQGELAAIKHDFEITAAHSGGT